MSRRSIATCLAVLAPGCGFLTEAGNDVTSEIRIELQVATRSGSAIQGIPLSVIESVRLTVVPESGDQIDSVKSLSTASPAATFGVTVEMGSVEFIAEVTSNNGSTLYTGSTLEDIRADGFQVTVPLQAVAPVMVVSRDSLDVSPDLPDSVEITNRGVGTLSWSISGTTPPDTSCAGPCLTFTPTSGDLTADQSQFVSVLAATDSTEPLLVQVTSAQGGVDLLVTTSPATGVFQLARAGGVHSCGLDGSGDAYCWGLNSEGELGDGTMTSRNSPMTVLGGLAFDTLVLADRHSCALTAGGAAYCWGSNGFGSIGDSTNSNRRSPVPVIRGITFKSITAGGAAANGEHSCGVEASGRAYCWGANSRGQLGNGGFSDFNFPVEVADSLGYTSITAGGLHTCALASDGSAYCWGSNSSGQLGGIAGDTALPIPVTGGLSFVTLDAGSFHTCGLTALGEAYCWGQNDRGQLGNGTTADTTAPVEVNTGLGFVAISAGGRADAIADHTCALTASGTAYCWGSNTRGQLGDGTTADRSTPVPVAGNVTFTSLTAGGLHTCGYTSLGAAYCWGLATWGQLGDGANTDRLIPTLVRDP